MGLAVGVVGLGYVGLTVAAAFADSGAEVYGVDTARSVVDSLLNGEAPIYEPDIWDILGQRIDRTFFVGPGLPSDALDCVIICVGTPVGGVARKPVLVALEKATAHVAGRSGPDTLVAVRSTVPVGATRRVVLPQLAQRWKQPLLVATPERSVQGRALQELRALPQIIGGLDRRSQDAAAAIFESVVSKIVIVSSLEAAELTKLVNNCAADVTYSFGNEVALIAEDLSLDPQEIMSAANLDYPRPNVAAPGYVGGSCLSKDPYLLMGSSRAYHPSLVPQARATNERIPAKTAETIIRIIEEHRGKTQGSVVAVLGWAYKGHPLTDDMRGSAVHTILPLLLDKGIAAVGHDPMVNPEIIRESGATPVGLSEAFRVADVVLIATNHKAYRDLSLDTLLCERERPLMIFDSWRLLDERRVTAVGVRYASIGYVADSEA